MITDASLAVCSWSLRPIDPAELLKQLHQTGLKRLQIALAPFREKPAVWTPLTELCASNGITFVSGMCGTVGEDYSTLESIERTGGVTPDATWDENQRNLQADADTAKTLGLKLVTLHAGFLPPDAGHPAFEKMLQRLKLIARIFAARNLDLAFETGQETAGTLRTFLRHLDQPNVGVNFDPANLILYDKGDPIAALRVLGSWLKQCHIKDAIRTKTPGTFGQEVVVGTGEVDWPAFFQAARELNFRGDFVIEREAGPHRVADICAARQFISPLLQ